MIAQAGELYSERRPTAMTTNCFVEKDGSGKFVPVLIGLDD